METKTLTKAGAVASAWSLTVLAAAGAAVPGGVSAAPLPEEITVTARFTEENVQDIPIAVAAINEEFLQEQNLTTTADILKLVPGVQFDQSFSSNDTRISIRGVNSSRGRASVALLVDGVDISGESTTVGGGSSLLNTRLFDLERVEVVKGPQSALYGRNAFAGAINYITKKPNLDEPEYSVGGDYGTDATFSVKGSASYPVIPGTLALRVNAASYQSDGFYTNPVNGQDLNGYEDNGARLAALWTPTDNVTVDASFAFERIESDPRAVVKAGDANTFYDNTGTLLPGVTDPTLVPPDGYGQWLGTIGTLNEGDINISNSELIGAPFSGTTNNQWLAIVKVGWDVGSVTLNSTTSFLDSDASIHSDVDYQTGVGSPNPSLGGAGASISNEFSDNTETTQFNQIFTVESNSWDRGRWLVGAQFYQERVETEENSLNYFNDPNLQFAPNTCGVIVACTAAESQAFGTPPKTTDRDTDSYSLFGLLSYDLTDRLTATVEARFIKDDIEAGTNTLFSRVDQSFFGLSVVQPTSEETSTREFNPRVALDYKLTDDVMFYGSVARGSKPGGYGTVQWARPELARLEPEELWAYELGAKTSWFDRKLIANVAVFFNQYNDRQVGITVTDPLNPANFPASGVSNAGEAETQGFEVDLRWQVTDNFSLSGAYAYTDAEWTDFDYREIRPDGNPTTKDIAICGNANGDCSGAPIAGIPENAFTAVADYRRPLLDTGMSWFANAVAEYVDKRPLSDQVRTTFVDERWRVDAQLGLQTETWTAMIYSTNLFDNETPLWGQGGQSDFRDGNYGNFGAPRDDTSFGFLPTPRIVGVRANFRFGQ